MVDVRLRDPSKPRPAPPQPGAQQPMPGQQALPGPGGGGQLPNQGLMPVPGATQPSPRAFTPPGVPVPQPVAPGQPTPPPPAVPPPPPPPTAPPVPPGQRGRFVVLNFDNADIETVIQAASEIIGFNYVLAPDVRGKVTVQTSGRIAQEEVFGVLLAILEVQGFTA